MTADVIRPWRWRARCLPAFAQLADEDQTWAWRYVLRRPNNRCIAAYHEGLAMSGRTPETAVIAARARYTGPGEDAAFRAGRALRRRLKRRRSEGALPHAFAVYWMPPRPGLLAQLVTFLRRPWRYADARRPRR